MNRVLLFFTIFLLLAPILRADESVPTISEKTAEMQKFSGYFTFYWDESEGEIWLEIDKLDTEFLYLVSLPAGVGSNDIGLDRGQLGPQRVVKFQRIGPKILLIEPNYNFRAITDNLQEKQAVEEAFAQSVLWGFTVAAEADSRVLVDAGDFFLRDAHDVIGTLKRTKQGNYHIDATRSAFYLPRSKNFPNNTEIEATLTFTGNDPGRYVRQVTPTPEAITVRTHHSFIKLPDGDFEPRKYDPRAGYFGISYLDYATPISEPIERQFIARHRLKKKNPGAEMSEPVTPIVYYLDPGAPEPIRSALLDGARWWNQAFEAAGFIDAFQVKMLPPDADPMDVRYNIIEWVHRATRGWSYGDAVMDPRTGEIVKGHILLGSLRVRQDFLIAAGLLSPYKDGTTVPPEMQEMALARLRQLAAHEVGHTLGLMHNFAASTSNRASVMDYPHPLVKIRNNDTLDLSDAYAVGIGEWDKITIRYGYSDFPNGANETAQLNKILQESFDRGLKYISDTDARPAGGAHPFAHLWDNGSDAADELLHVLNVRNVALQHFSENNIRTSMPMASLEEALAPVYFFHRYQTEAAVKLLGGLNYSYALRGDGQLVTEIVSAEAQKKALQALLQTIDPQTLALPERILRIIPPRTPDMRRNRETFTTRTGITFDPLAAAEAAANQTLRLLLHPERAARLVEYHARDKKYPGFDEVIAQIFDFIFNKYAPDGLLKEIRRTVSYVALYHLMHLVTNEDATPQVRAIAAQRLKMVQQNLQTAGPKGVTESKAREAHRHFVQELIRKFFDEPWKIDIPQPLDPPAGSPIGSFSCGSGPN